MTLAISIVIALIGPVVFLYLLRGFDLHKTAKFSRNIVTLICGIVAYLFAFWINRSIIDAGLATRTQIIRVVAPVAEEILKSAILIYLVTRANFNYVVDGALYGFGAGVGFALIENVEYVTGRPELALMIAVARVFSTNLVHATGSGVIGTALAYSRGQRGKARGAAVILGGYALAILFHALFNTMVNAGTFLAFAIGYGVVGMALIWYIIKRGMDVQKVWVAEKLGMGDRVTQEETRVVSNIEMVNEVLKPIEARFGAEKTSLVRNLIYKQAEIGIKRKLIETAQSEARRHEIEAIIQELVKDINDIRKQIGAYCMMMVREVYLGQDLQIWNLLNARIAAAGPGQKGGGLWDRVSERMRDSSTTQEESKS
ncbi:MAG: hypothetical protein JETCAE01_24600 [Anaerolineaceae bacterium]|nr:MAG: hypothetical protein JETCAE01_24600 [Anaerolineaceae bacterium]